MRLQPCTTSASTHQAISHLHANLQALCPYPNRYLSREANNGHSDAAGSDDAGGFQTVHCGHAQIHQHSLCLFLGKKI